MTMLSKTLTCSVASLSLVAFAFAQTPRTDTEPGAQEPTNPRAPRAQATMTTPQFLPAGELLGASIVDASGSALGTIANVEIDPRTGRAETVILEDDARLTMKRLTWDGEAKRFQASADVDGLTSGDAAKSAEVAAADRAARARAMDASAGHIGIVMLADLEGADLVHDTTATRAPVKLDGAEAKREGTGSQSTEEKDRAEAEGKEQSAENDLGSVAGAHVDVANGYVRFVTTSVGGVLGVGGDEKLIPWSLVRFERNGDDELRVLVPLTAEKLKNAPALEDEQKLDDAATRRTIYSYYGVSENTPEVRDRPKSDVDHGEPKKDGSYRRSGNKDQ